MESLESVYSLLLYSQLGNELEGLWLGITGSKEFEFKYHACWPLLVYCIRCKSTSTFTNLALRDNLCSVYCIVSVVVLHAMLTITEKYKLVSAERLQLLDSTCEYKKEGVIHRVVQPHKPNSRMIETLHQIHKKCMVEAHGGHSSLQ